MQCISIVHSALSTVHAVLCITLTRVHFAEQCSSVVPRSVTQ